MGVARVDAPDQNPSPIVMDRTITLHRTGSSSWEITVDGNQITTLEGIETEAEALRRAADYRDPESQKTRESEEDEKRLLRAYAVADEALKSAQETRDEALARAIAAIRRSARHREIMEGKRARGKNETG